MSYGIFKNEETILRQARETLAGDRLRDPADRALYADIVTAYDNLFQLTQRLVRVGDYLAGDQRETASIDTLTRIPNRRRFEQLAELELARARRYAHPIAVLVVDLDHFKAVNDSHGHLVGDMVLRQVAVILRNALRDVDKLGRWGGEEFVALLPETGRAGAAILADRLCESVAAATIAHDDVSIACTVSIGVAAMSEPPASLDEIFSLADQAVYRAKDAGRNQIACAWDEA